MQRLSRFVLAAALVIAPLGARAADLVVWWDEGYYAEEDEAVREIIAAFEQKTGKQVELTFHPDTEFAGKLVPAVEAGRPPDFAIGTLIDAYYSEWALTDRLIDLTDTIGSFSHLFDPDTLAWWTLRNATTGRMALYALPMGQYRQYAHVWKSLLEQAGFTLEDIPREWEAFWAFWCDDVQPAVRRTLGRNDVFGVGLSMAADNPAGHAGGRSPGGDWGDPCARSSASRSACSHPSARCLPLGNRMCLCGLTGGDGAGAER
jgi:multiple sugar transport system substrate-binding protein